MLISLKIFNSESDSLLPLKYEKPKFQENVIFLTF